MNDLECLLNDVPWLASDDTKISIISDNVIPNISNLFQTNFPNFAKLINCSKTTRIQVGSEFFTIHAWDNVNGHRMGWLSPNPVKTVVNKIFSKHELLLNNFGGITERFNEPEEGWLLNTNSSLTISDCKYDATFLNTNDWLIDVIGPELPIPVSHYYAISIEANGNTTFCNRINGEIILYAPDHCFTHVSEYPGFPPYSIYSITGINKFDNWVEAIADQWLSEIA